MGASWSIVRERFPLSDLGELSKATGGASKDWVFVEPSVAEVDRATKGGKNNDKDAMESLTRSCVLDSAGAPVFGDQNSSFSDLPPRAVRELSRFVLDRTAPPKEEDEEDRDGGKP